MKTAGHLFAVSYIAAFFVCLNASASSSLVIGVVPSDKKKTGCGILKSECHWDKSDPWSNIYYPDVAIIVNGEVVAECQDKLACYAFVDLPAERFTVKVIERDLEDHDPVMDEATYSLAPMKDQEIDVAELSAEAFWGLVTDSSDTYEMKIAIENKSGNVEHEIQGSISFIYGGIRVSAATGCNSSPGEREFQAARILSEIWRTSKRRQGEDINALNIHPSLVTYVFESSELSEWAQTSEELTCMFVDGPIIVALAAVASRDPTGLAMKHAREMVDQGCGNVNKAFGSWWRRYSMIADQDGDFHWMSYLGRFGRSPPLNRNSCVSWVSTATITEQ